MPTFLPLLLIGFAAAPAPAGAPASVAVAVSAKRIGMGRTVAVAARVTDRNGKPAAGCQLLPYVNGKRWGPHEVADAQGRALFRFPLPMVGTASIRVQARPAPQPPDDWWIWAGVPKDNQTVYLQRTFVPAAVPTGGLLWVAADDSCTVFINGTRVAEKAGWHDNKPIVLPAAAFRDGVNVLSVEAHNGLGPAGLLMNLTVNTPRGDQKVLSDSTWRAFLDPPAGWPAAVGEEGSPATGASRADSYAANPEPWPTIPVSLLITGTPLPPGAVASVPVTVRVDRRKLQRLPADPEHIVAIQWEEWFTPHNAWWQTAQAVPTMGFYDSFLPEVARQHLIWFIESGVDCVIADWSNNIWNAKEWAPGEGTLELVRASHVMMREMAMMRAEGYAVPRMTFLTGIDYERPEGPKVVNEQLAYIWDNYVSKPEYKGLWQEFDGKPLVLALDVGAGYAKEGVHLDDRFTVRYEGAQQDHNHNNDVGLWSWMDHFAVPTLKDGKVEGLTVCVGSFGPKGWLGDDARGRRNGATFVEDWSHALKLRPRFLQVHQFQEFAGQPEGQPVGEPKVYVDVYSPPLSDDMEPTSLTAHAYRGEGGWGYLYLNLLRCMMDLYRSRTPETTVIAMSSPLRNQVVDGDKLVVTWVAAGRPPTGYRVEVNGKTLASGVKGNRVEVDLAQFVAGSATLRLTAQGGVTRYRLSWTEDSLPLAKVEPVSVEVPFVIRRERAGANRL